MNNGDGIGCFFENTFLFLSALDCRCDTLGWNGASSFIKRVTVLLSIKWTENQEPCRTIL